MNAKLFALGVCFLLLARPLCADELTRQVQEELRKRNLYFGDIDGRQTPGLAGALASYQQRKGFPSSGTPTVETLSSLSLVPPPSGPPPLPDLPVLKSDAGRQAAAPPAPDTAQTAALISPPPAAAQRRAITPDEARLFVERYLLAGQTNDPAAEAAMYADRVDYFNDGKVDRRYIEHDIRRYDARWPERYFKLDRPARVTSTDNGSNIVVDIDYHFTVKGAKYSVQGKVGTTYTLAGNRPEDLRIVQVKEQRVRR